MIQQYAKWLRSRRWGIKSWEALERMICARGRRVVYAIELDYAAGPPSPDEIF
jgi:IS5 family transposase